MSTSSKYKKQKVLSRSMTVAEIEEWFEAEFAKAHRRIARKRKTKSLPAPSSNKERPNA